MKTKIRYVFFVLGAAAVFGLGAGPALAAPFKADNNPQIVANYPTGPHGIVGEPYLHEGADVVMRAGNSGVFQQWFYGTSEGPNGTHGDHSVWMPAKDGKCPNDSWILVPNASASWGDYLLPGDYCVHTNVFHPTK